MDSYLTGREQIGQSPKKKDVAVIGPKVLGELAQPPSQDTELNESCGEGGSRVAYLTEDGKVTKIVVTCGCGQVTEIDCKYED